MKHNSHHYIGYVIALLIATLCIIPISSAIPIRDVQINTGTDGLRIEYPIVEYSKINHPILMNFHVYNATSGITVDYALISCSFHLYDNLGYHININTSMKYDGTDFELGIPGSNFSYFGDYDYIVYCNNSNLNYGGSVTVPMKINGSGRGLDLSGAVLYTLGFILLISCLMINIYYWAKTNSTNNPARKMGLFYGIYLLVTILTFFVWDVSSEFLTSTVLIGIMETTWKLMLWFMLPLYLGGILWLIFVFIKMKEYQKLLKRGGR